MSAHECVPVSHYSLNGLNPLSDLRPVVCTRGSEGQRSNHPPVPHLLSPPQSLCSLHRTGSLSLSFFLFRCLSYSLFLSFFSFSLSFFLFLSFFSLFLFFIFAFFLYFFFLLFSLPVISLPSYSLRPLSLSFILFLSFQFVCLSLSSSLSSISYVSSRP